MFVQMSAYQPLVKEQLARISARTVKPISMTLELTYFLIILKKL